MRNLRLVFNEYPDTEPNLSIKLEERKDDGLTDLFHNLYGTEIYRVTECYFKEKELVKERVQLYQELKEKVPEFEETMKKVHPELFI